MKNCAIDNAVDALEQAIQSRKIHIQNTRTHSGPAPLMSHLLSEIMGRAGGSYGQITQVLGQGRNFVQEFVKKTQQNIHSDPWEVLRKVAVYSFTAGLFLSMRHKKSSTREKA